MKFSIIIFAVCILSIIGCKKTPIYNSKKVADKFYAFSLCSDMFGEYNENVFFQNDTIFYEVNRAFMFNRGKKFLISDSLQPKEIIRKFNLQKVDNRIFMNHQNYRDHFSYKDCLTDKEVKSDSGQVTTLKTKKGSVIQYIDLKNKPIILQINSKLRKYKMPVKLQMQTTDQIFTRGFGTSHAMLYDIDKDGNDELLIVYDSECVDALAYKLAELED